MNTSNRIRIFIKVKRSGKFSYLFSCVTLGLNKTSSTLYSEVSYNRITTMHRILLDAVDRYLSFVEPVDPELNCILTFYTGSDEIAYEWNNEYIKEGSFGKDTQDIDLYSRIIRKKDMIGVAVDFVGNNNIFSSIRKVV